MTLELGCSTIGFEDTGEVDRGPVGPPYGFDHTWFSGEQHLRWCSRDESLRTTLRAELQPTLGDSIAYEVANCRCLEFRPAFQPAASDTPASDTSASDTPASDNQIPGPRISNTPASDTPACPASDMAASHTASHISSSATAKTLRKSKVRNRTKALPNTRRNRRHRRDQILIDDASD